MKTLWFSVWNWGHTIDFIVGQCTGDVINALAAYFKISREYLLRRKSNQKISRQVAMYLCTIYCNSRVSMSDLGKLFSLSGVAIARNRVKRKRKEDKELTKAVNDIRKSTVSV